MFIIFGINCGNKFFCQLLTSITIICFLMYLLHIPLTIFIEHNLTMILMKFGTTLMTLAHLMSYLYIRYRSEKIFELYEELKCFQKQSHNTSEYRRIFFALLFFLPMVYFSIQILFNDTMIDQLFNIKLIQVDFMYRSVPFLFHWIGWLFALQLINHELNSRYSEIIEEFLHSLKRRNSLKSYKPSKQTLIKSQSVLHKFIHFKTEINKNLKFVKVFIITEFYSYSIIFIVMFSVYLNQNNYFSCVLVLCDFTIMTIFYCWIQFRCWIRQSYTRQISYELGKWQQFVKDIDLAVDLQVLAQTVSLFLNQSSKPTQERHSKIKNELP